jgi:pyrroline-5-carboxylate reductase
MNRILFYGGGNIAQAIISGLLSSGLNKSSILYIDRNKTNRLKLKKLGIKKYSASDDAIDLIILCVKPKDALDAYKAIAKNFSKPKVISLVAGVGSRKYLSISRDVKLVRGMPNTSSQHGMGITALLNINASKALYKNIKKLFNQIGITLDISNEKTINDFTGLIGSGPAYFYYLLKSYEKALTKMVDGDSKNTKLIMANLMSGIGESIKGDKSIDELIKSVASKRGTTEAGLKVMKAEKMTESFNKSIKAAINRAKEISNES